MTDIAQFLKENTALKVLFLAKNQLSSRGAIMLFSSLTSNQNSNIRVLRVDQNSIDDEAVNEIFRFLMDNNVLVELDIGHNKFSDQALLVIMQSLEYNRTLERFLISYDVIRRLESKILKLKKRINRKIKYHIIWITWYTNYELSTIQYYNLAYIHDHFSDLTQFAPSNYFDNLRYNMELSSSRHYYYYKRHYT